MDGHSDLVLTDEEYWTSSVLLLLCFSSETCPNFRRDGERSRLGDEGIPPALDEEPGVASRDLAWPDLSAILAVFVLGRGGSSVDLEVHLIHT